MFSPLYSFFLCLSFFVVAEKIPDPAPLPEPTPEISKLIKELGDKEFRVRERATKELKSIGWNALKGVKDARKNPDVEIRNRAEYIYESYFFLLAKSGNMPSIWLLPNLIRYPDGYELNALENISICKPIDKTDIAKEYYIKAHKLSKGTTVVEIWTERYIQSLATYLYIKDYLLAGKEKIEMGRFLDKLEKSSNNYDNYRQSKSLDQDSFDWYENPPGPLLPKEDFKDPDIYSGPG